MSVTQLKSEQYGASSVKRQDLDVTNTGAAVVAKLIAGTNVTFAQTGPDVGTGDVTINATGIGGGTTETASNVNTTGVGVFDAKVINDLQFKGINAASSFVTVTNNVGTKSIDVNVAPANFIGIPLTTAVTGILPIANGGTNSSTQNFIDLTTSQTKNVGITASTTPLLLTGSINDFLQEDIKNTSTGTAAQSGYSATADNGTVTSLFTWIGKNNSAFNNPQLYNVGTAGDGTILNDGGNLWIHNTGTTGKIAFSTGNVSTPFYTERMAINGNGSIAFGGAVGTVGQVLQSTATSSPTWLTLGSNALTSTAFAPIANGLQQFTGTTLANLPNNATPTTPAAASLNIYSSTLSGATVPKFIDEKGVDNFIQSGLARNNISMWLPVGNSPSTVTLLGLTTPTIVGTSAQRNVATTNIATRKKRIGYLSATTAAALAEARIAVAQYTAGTGVANDGSGFRYSTTFVPSNAATVTGERFFIGLSSNIAAATNVEPNTQTNTIGIGQLSTDATQFYVIFGGSTAQTAIACGTGLGAPNTLSTALYELSIYAPQTVANTFYLTLTNLGTGVAFITTLTGAGPIIPQSNTLLAHKAWKTNNATALAVGFDIGSIYFENK